ncbi:hypothetical protein OSTOST_18510, partial [Ostertagia ostertagi]
MLVHRIGYPITQFCSPHCTNPHFRNGSDNFSDRRCGNLKELEIVFLSYFWKYHPSLLWDMELVRKSWGTLRNSSIEVPDAFKLYTTKFVCFIVFQQLRSARYCT